MRLPSPLRKLDDRVLGNRLPGNPRDEDDGDLVERKVMRERPSRPPGASRARAREALTVVYQISRVVFLLLALVVVLGIAFTLAPTNLDNVIVRNALDIADGAAGPFKDVFTVDDDQKRELVVNYAFAGCVYLLAAGLVRKLPGGKS